MQLERKIHELYNKLKSRILELKKFSLQHFEMIGKQSGERVRQHLNLQPSKNQTVYHPICLKPNAESKR